MRRPGSEKRKRFISRAGISRGCLLVLLIFVTCVSLTSCAMGRTTDFLPEAISSSGEESKNDTGFVPTGYDSFDSADTAICMKKDAENKTVTLWNLTVGRNYTLQYDGTTVFSDKYGESISFAQVSPGDIVEVTFLKAKKHLTSLRLSPQTWSLEKVTFFDLDAVQGVATIGQDEKKWKITANTKAFVDGMPLELSEIDPSDTLSFQGIDTQVLTVKVEKGHGYLRLTGQEKFIGGWLEIGKSQIQRIREEMLLSLPEGTYPVTVSKDESGGEKVAVIHRNEETVLDISDLEVAEPETGTILFSISPSSAKLYVDGEKTDASLPVTLVYGIHQLMIKADGYQTLTQYVRVGQPSIGLDISLDLAALEGEDGQTGTEKDLTADYDKVYVDAPSGAEVFLDGNYVGMTPCSFRKVEGSHVIMLRKVGYQSKSYTVQFGNDDKDISYSFADLDPNSSNASQNEASTPDFNGIVNDILGNLME